MILIKPFKQILDFEGRASIPEFWIFFGFTLLLSFFLGILNALFNLPEIVRTSFLVIVGFVNLSLGFRRLNDVGVNKFLFLLPFVNLILAGLPSKE